MPGWTLPGVLTCGAAQTLLKSHGLVPDTRRGRLVLAGCGPLLLLLAAQLTRARVKPAALMETSVNRRAALPYLPGFLLSPGYLSKGLALLRELKAAGVTMHKGITSYVCVVDRHGNAFSATPSDGSSAMPVIPGTGLCPSSRGSQSSTDPAHPAALAPGKRPRLTPNPALALKDGKLFMPFGSPGNDVQPQAMTQVFLNMVVFGMEPQAAVEAPRFASYSYPSSSAPHDYHPGRLNLEARFDKAVTDKLAKMGHQVAPWQEVEWRAGAVCAIRVNEENGLLEGAADPRRPCYALGI